VVRPPPWLKGWPATPLGALATLLLSAFFCLSVFSLIFASVTVSVPYAARKMRAKRTNRVLFCWMSMKNLFFFFFKYLSLSLQFSQSPVYSIKILFLKWVHHEYIFEPTPTSKMLCANKNCKDSPMQPQQSCLETSYMVSLSSILHCFSSSCTLLLSRFFFFFFSLTGGGRPPPWPRGGQPPPVGGSATFTFFFFFFFFNWGWPTTLVGGSATSFFFFFFLFFFFNF
jgi:hypothetical protein